MDTISAGRAIVGVPTVETVRGPVELDQLGRALMHEHVFIMQPEALQNWGNAFGENYWDEEERVAEAVRKLTEVREAGIATIVDPTVPGLGRYIPRIRRVAEAAEINIIVATGVYAFMELPNFLGYRTTRAIADLFIREIREGINDTGVKAAFLKCAVERHGIVADVPRILEAIAIADRGAWLGHDRFGIEHFNPLEDRIRTLSALLAEGYGDRIHLSHDGSTFFDFMVGDPFFADEKADYVLISRQVLPRLIEAGVTQEQIDQMMVDNPRRFFGGSLRSSTDRFPADAARTHELSP